MRIFSSEKELLAVFEKMTFAALSIIWGSRDVILIRADKERLIFVPFFKITSLGPQLAKIAKCNFSQKKVKNDQNVIFWLFESELAPLWAKLLKMALTPTQMVKKSSFLIIFGIL